MFIVWSSIGGASVVVGDVINVDGVVNIANVCFVDVGFRGC